MMTFNLTCFDAVSALDFTLIKLKLMHPAGKRWSAARANAVELEYRRFLYMCKLFPHQAPAPLIDVDIFWHQHIADTRKYADDCQQVFGYFLHHKHLADGQEQEQTLHTLCTRTRDQYEQVFGQPYGGAAGPGKLLRIAHVRPVARLASIDRSGDAPAPPPVRQRASFAPLAS